jgi:hypothetical protein
LEECKKSVIKFEAILHKSLQNRNWG